MTGTRNQGDDDAECRYTAVLRDAVNEGRLSRSEAHMFLLLVYGPGAADAFGGAHEGLKPIF